MLALALVFQVKSVPAYQSAKESQGPGQSQTSPAIKTPQSATEATITAKNQDPPADKIKRSEWVQIFIGAFAAIVILWQAWIYNQQRKIMKQQVETARVSERAYIGIKMVETKNFVVGQTPVVHVVVLNGGRTPAWKVKVPTTLRIAEPTRVPEDHFETSDKESSTFLPAGISIDFNYPFPFVLTPSWQHAILTGQRRVFLSGEVHFEDCWGEKRVFPFKAAYKHKTGGWGDYKDPEDTEGQLSIIN